MDRRNHPVNMQYLQVDLEKAREAREDFWDMIDELMENPT